MKRGTVVLFLLLGITIPLQAVKRITIAQLEQLISAPHARQDAELAYQIADVQLTERIGADRIARISASLPGDKSRQALTAIAAASEFQLPPQNEMPATAAPDLAAQRRIMSLVADYVTKAIPQLPNFFATRTTTRYEDTPLLQRPDAFFTPYEPLHSVGVSSVTVVYRDGREIQEQAAKAPKTMPQGLNSWGEFGPILTTILLDAAQNKLAWSHWEQGPAGVQAVFSYEVPKEKSHYEVNYCCVANPGTSVSVGGHYMTPSRQAAGDANLSPFRQIAGYRGKMAVDPKNGTILRLSVEATLKSDGPVSRADLLVDYGSVEVGGKSYICPVKSVSITTAQMVQTDDFFKRPMSDQLQPLKTMLNDVKFEDYHMFRAESRVLTAENKQDQLPTPGAVTPETSDNNGPADAAQPPTTPATPETAPSSLPPSPALAVPPEPATAAAPPLPDLPEISETGNADIPNTPLRLPVAPPSGFTLRTTTRLVDVGLVAYDKKGHPVTDLKQTDFEIYDNGRKQEIKNVEQAGKAASPATSPQPDQSSAAAPAPVYSNRQTEPVLNSRPAATESHVTILLIDASNLAWGDLSYAREEMLRFLKGLKPGEPVGLYIMRSYGFQVLLEPTADHAEAAAQLSRWMPSAQDLARAQDEEQRNRQHMDWVHRLSDLLYVNGNEATDPSQFYSGRALAAAEGTSVDPQLRQMGSNPQRDALFNLQVVARHLGTIPGHKSLVWISSDNALADWRSQAAGREDRGSNFVDPIAVHTREALNEAHVSIYPLDASQLEAGVITADLENRLIKSINGPKPGEPPAPPPNPTGRYAAQMHQDTHSIDGTFRDLATATGGRTLRRAGDIAAELNGIAEDGRAAYLLSFSPDGPADDKYHVITVKLAGRRDLTLRYRTGYLYEKDPATLKERFHRAVWQPRDMNDVGVSATAAGSGKDRTLKLKIAATDLEMAQLDDLWTDKLDIFVIDRDDSTLSAKFTSRTLALHLRPATYQKVLREGIPVEQPLPARPNAGSVRILVVDENSGRMGSITSLRADSRSSRRCPLLDRKRSRNLLCCFSANVFSDLQKRPVESQTASVHRQPV
jgi:VWFA-related protein